MSAFLRRGNRVQAMEMYNEMIKRGIQPNSDAYGGNHQVMSDGRNARFPESLPIANKFLKYLSKEDRKWKKDDS